MSTRRPAALIALAGVGLFGTGCFEVWDSARFERDVELVFDLPEGAGIAAQTENGAITLSEAERADLLVRAHIRATTQERADAVQIVTDASDPAWLAVYAQWPSQRTGSEGVSFEIEGAGGRPVRARSSNGKVSVAGFAGGADLDTSNGAVEVDGHEGPVTARTSNGAIMVLGATEGVRAGTSNGAVRVELAPGGAGPVDIDTSNGGVTLVVGSAFAGRIEGDTSNGSVRFDGSGAVEARLLQDERTHKVVQIGSGEQQSVIDTSNGSISISVRE